MLGFATFVAAGGLGHAWQRLPATRYHAAWMDAAYWLLLGGLLLMVGDLTIAGLVQAGDWEAGRTWIEIPKQRMLDRERRFDEKDEP